MQGRGVGLMDYSEALRTLVTLEASDGNIAEAAAKLAGLATGGRARVVAFSPGGGAEFSCGLDDQTGAEAFARELCGRRVGTVSWPELSSLVSLQQLEIIGLSSPAFVPVTVDETVYGALWCEAPDNGGENDGGLFLQELQAHGDVIAVSLRNRERFQRIRSHGEITNNLLEHMDACMCVIDAQNDDILFMNSRMREEYGLNGDVTGKKCWQVFERDKTGRCHFCPAYLLEKNPDEPIVWERHSEINGRHYKNTNSIVEWTDGRRAHLQHSVDITAEKDVQQGFVEAKQTAGTASGARNDFLSRLSHEIRAPLNTIMGMTRIALDSDDPARARECLQKIDASSNNLLSLLNDVLDILMIEADKMRLAREPFDFERMVDKVSGEIAVRSNEKNQRLRVLVGESVPRFFTGDESRVAQVLSNFLSNAVKYTPDGGTISMDIKEKTRISGNSVLEVTISDTGIGIPQNRIPTLFTPFSQTNGGIAVKHGGTGLGLAIAKSIISMMHGDIYIESELGKGSTFIFNMEMERAASGSIQNGEAAGNEKRLFFAGYRVLIAEDEEVHREVLVMTLESKKLKLDCAKNGREAVNKFAADQNAYDLILMDADMPELDGFEAARVIRGMHSERAKKIPILAMTANVSGDYAAKSLECGMNDYLAKPLDFDRLFEMLQRYLVEFKLPEDCSADVAAVRKPAPKPPAQSDIPYVDGIDDFIDVADALGRVRGNRKIYKTLLQSFAKDSGIPALKEDVLAKKFPPAARAAHSIKGASANLSLVAVYRASVLLESQLKMDYCDEDGLAGLESAFEETSRYIDELVKLL